jgi:acetyl-CoA carboxylase biotin carboxylase subunit
MDRALSEFQIRGPGVRTTLDLHRAILRHPEFRADAHTVQFLDRHLPDLIKPLDVGWVGSVVPLPSHPAPSHPRGASPMPIHAFALQDLMSMLTSTAGLDPVAHTDDPEATLEEIGLDSLAFLALQTELNDRYGFEFPEETTAQSTFGEMARYVDERLASTEAAHAEAS